MWFQNDGKDRNNSTVVNNCSSNNIYSHIYIVHQFFFFSGSGSGSGAFFLEPKKPPIDFFGFFKSESSAMPPFRCLNFKNDHSSDSALFTASPFWMTKWHELSTYMYGIWLASLTLLGSTGKRLIPPAFCHSAKVRDLKDVIPVAPRFLPCFFFASCSFIFFHCSLEIPLR